MTCLLLGGLLSPGLSSAQWVPGGVSVCGSACIPSFPIVATDGAGSVFVTWRDRRTNATTGADVYIQRVTAAGEIAPGWPQGGVPLCTLPEFQSPGSITTDGSGGAIVVWVDLRDMGTTGIDLYAQRILADGSIAPGWPANGAPVTRAPSQQTMQAVVADGSGGALVLWDDQRNLAISSFDIYAQHLTATGDVAAGWPPDGLPVSIAAEYQSVPRAIADGSGGFIAAWCDGRGGAHGIRLHGDGTLAAGWTADGSLLAPGRYIPFVAPDGAGGFYLASSTVDAIGFDLEYHVQRFGSDGSTAPGWPPGGVLVCDAPDVRTGLDIAPDEAGGLLMAWYDYRIGASEIFAARVLPDGSLPWTPDGVQVSVLTPPSSEANVEIIADGFGGMYITWERETGGREVLVQHLSPSGAVVPGWPTEGVRVKPGLLSQFNPVLASDGAGGAIVVWEQRNASDLLAQRFQVDGPVAVLLSLASVEAEPDRVTLAWQGPGAGALAARVERRSESDDWRDVGPAAPDGVDRLLYVDRDVRAGGRYAYRLVYLEDGLERRSTVSWIEVPEATQLHLAGFRPNPARGVPHIAFSLPSAATVRLEVLDVSGRQRWQRRESYPAGHHRIALDHGTDLAPGVYLIRLVAGGTALSVRSAVVR